MNTYSWICVGLGTFDLVLVVLLSLQLHAQPPLDRRTVSMVGAIMGGFIFHAWMFFSGTILFLQIATCLALFGLVFVAYRKQEKRSC